MKPGCDRLLTMAQDADLLTMGIAVSGNGDIHDGHRVTMLNFLRTLAEFPNLEGLFMIEDREHSYSRMERDQRVRCGIKLPVLHDIQKNIASAIAEISDYLCPSGGDTINGRLRVINMSDFYSETNDSQRGSEALLTAIQKAQRDGLFSVCFGDIYGSLDDKKVLRPLLRPLSPDLQSSPRKVKKYEIDLDENKINVQNAIYLDGVMREPMQIDMIDQTNWSLHFLLTGALRDAVLAACHGGQSILHVFGGDYAAASGNGGITKIERIKVLVGELTASVPNAKAEYFVGPLLTNGGKKISKSIGNTGSNLPLDDLYHIALQNSGSAVEIGA